MSVIIGIDPGITGAIAVLDSDAENILTLVDMPTIPDGKKRKISGNGLRDIFKHYPASAVKMVYFEKVGARPGQGVVSMFSFGRTVGAVETLINYLGYPMTYVTPAKWKRSAGLLKTEKDASRGKVLDLYPTAAVTRKKDNGRADAVLIARYGDQ